MTIKRPAVLFLFTFIYGVLIAYEPVSLVFKLIIGCIAIFLCIKLIYDRKIYMRIVVVLFAFCIIGFLRFKYIEEKFDRYVANVENLGRGNKTITGIVDSIGKSTNSNYFVISNCISDGMNLGKCRCYFTDEIEHSVKIGNTVLISAGTAIIDGPSNEGEFNQKNYYRSDGITFIAFAREVNVINTTYDYLRQRIYEIKLIIKSQIFKIFNYKDAGLFSAMVTGDKTSIDKELKRKFADNGIAHILAISGLHLSILGVALFELLRRKFSVNFSAAFVSAFILLYGIFIDAGPASLRAIAMLFIRFLSLAIGRTYDSRNTLYIIALVFVIYNPYLLFNAGFQFSYVAIFALNQEIVISPKYKRVNIIENIKLKHIKTREEFFSRQFKEENIKLPAVITLTFFLFPVTVYHYFTYPLYSIFLNLIVIPLMSFVLGFGLLSLGISFLSIKAGSVIAMIVHVIFLLYDKLCDLIEMLPAHIVVIGKPTLYEMLLFYFVLFLVMYILNERLESIKEKFINLKIKKLLLRKDDTSNAYVKNQNGPSLEKEKYCKGIFRILICIVLLFMATLILSIRKHSDMRMTFISIGQGDSILIEAKDLIITIDGGSTSNTSNGQYVLSPHIKSRAISHIDYAYITHADADHTNGIMYLLENEDEVYIYNLVLPITSMNDAKFSKIKSLATERGTKVSYMKEGDVAELKNNIILTVLNPNEGSIKSKKIDQNEMSLTFRLDYNGHSALFTGDIGSPTMNRMLKDDFAIENMDVDVFKVPHHGSKNSNVPEFYEIVSPEYSIISYGKNNNYGHPNKEVIDSLSAIDSKILKTGESGQIDIYFDKEKIEYNLFSP